MQINLVSCIFILDSEKNENIRKNDIKKLKLLVTKDSMLPNVLYKGNEIKKEIKEYIEKIIGTKKFHLEQVYTSNTKDSVDIIYLAITNIENIKKLNTNYSLIDFNVKNSIITYGNNNYTYVTKEIIENNNIEYIHEVKVKDEILKYNLVNVLTCYKRIRSNIDNTDILFKFMGSVFTLEDVRILYELIKGGKVDKSNFRKRIVKYCEKVDVEDFNKIAYRPSQKYKFKPLKGDVWL